MVGKGQNWVIKPVKCEALIATVLQQNTPTIETYLTIWLTINASWYARKSLKGNGKKILHQTTLEKESPPIVIWRFWVRMPLQEHMDRRCVIPIDRKFTSKRSRSTQPSHPSTDRQQWGVTERCDNLHFTQITSSELVKSQCKLVSGWWGGEGYRIRRSIPNLIGTEPERRCLMINWHEILTFFCDLQPHSSLCREFPWRGASEPRELASCFHSKFNLSPIHSTLLYITCVQILELNTSM